MPQKVTDDWKKIQKQIFGNVRLQRGTFVKPLEYQSVDIIEFGNWNGNVTKEILNYGENKVSNPNLPYTCFRRRNELGQDCRKWYQFQGKYSECLDKVS